MLDKLCKRGHVKAGENLGPKSTCRQCVRDLSFAWHRERAGIPLDAPKYLAKPPQERWWKFVSKTPTCWVWIGAQGLTGYGHFINTVSSNLAHRFGYLMLVGPIPEGLQLDHLCRNRLCVNPEHLDVVTPQTNTLRGDTLAAQNASKDECKRGHKFDAVNTYLYQGSRCCRECRRTAKRERRRLNATSEGRLSA